MASFEEKHHPIKKIVTLGLGGDTEQKRRIGKSSRTATAEELALKEKYKKDIIDLQKTKQTLYNQFNQALGGDLAVQGDPNQDTPTPSVDTTALSPREKVERAREIAMTVPKTEGELEALYAEFYQLDPKVADTWFEQQARRFQGKDKEEKATPAKPAWHSVAGMYGAPVR